MTSRQNGVALVVGLVLLSLISLLALAGAAAAHVELQLARNEQFRENAASAATAGIELAISRIVTAPAPNLVTPTITASLPGESGRSEVRISLVGPDSALPQLPGAGLRGFHFDIVSTGHSGRGAIDRQRARVMQVIAAESGVAVDCEPLAPGVRCAFAGELRRLSWQRLPGA